MRISNIKFFKIPISFFILKIIIISKIYPIKPLIVLPFNIKTKYQQSDEFFSKYLSTNFEIGEPPQNIEAEIDFQESDFHLSYTRKYIPLLYNKTKSNKYINTSLYRITTKNFASGCKANESFYFFEDEKLINKQKYENISFFMATNMDKLFCAILGFELSWKGIRGFIGSLKNSKAINSYTWTLKFNSIDNGLLIIGEEPHVYNNTYDESKLKYTKIYMYKNYFSWSISFSNVIYGELIYKKNIIGIIRPDIKGLIAPLDYYENLEKIYLKAYLENNICQKIEIYEKNITNNDYFDEQKMLFYKIECDKNEFSLDKIENFPVLKFINIPLNYSFIFDGKDLFKEENNKYIFQIYISDIKFWYIGRLFLYKYQFIYNEDNKLIGLYTGFKNNSNNNNNIFKIILIIFFSFMLIFIFFILYKKIRLLNRKNKKYANELEDNFSYKNDFLKESKNMKDKNNNSLFEKND